MSKCLVNKVAASLVLVSLYHNNRLFMMICMHEVKASFIIHSFIYSLLHQMAAEKSIILTSLTLTNNTVVILYKKY